METTKIFQVLGPLVLVGLMAGPVVGRGQSQESTSPGGPAAAEAAPLAPLEFLAGACWQGTFPDGKSTDTHCYRSFYEGAFLRDMHRVVGERPDYHGETIYHHDPETGQIVYRYWNSRGGVSDGVVIPGDGRLLFPGERHVTEEGEVIELQSVIEPGGPDGYVSVTEQKAGDEWRELWRIEFRRLAPATRLGAAARQQAERLEELAALVGDWADPAKLAEATEAGTQAPVQFAYRWGPRRMLLRVYEGLAVSHTGHEPDPMLEGMVFWDHVARRYAFAASTRFGWTFDGGYEVLDDGRIQRVYEVHYAEDEEYIPEPGIDGQVRRFREIYQLEGPDRLSIALDIWKDGAWRPFGPGRYEAVRLSD